VTDRNRNFGMFAQLFSAKALAENNRSSLSPWQLALNAFSQRQLKLTLENVLITDPRRPGNPIIYCTKGFEKLTGPSVTRAGGGMFAFHPASAGYSFFFIYKKKNS
jgi:hypothetical protein